MVYVFESRARFTYRREPARFFPIRSRSRRKAFLTTFAVEGKTQRRSRAVVPNHLEPVRYVIAFDPRIETAAWLILAAVAGCLGLILTEMVKKLK